MSRINSDRQIKTAEEMLKLSNGSWAAIHNVSKRDENGVYVVKKSELEQYIKDNDGKTINYDDKHNITYVDIY